MSPRPALVLLAVVALAGCPRKPAAIVDAGVVDAGPAASAAESAKLAATLASALRGTPCPPGTRRMGAEPPDGHEAWCERSGNGGKPEKEGPYEAWHDNGVKAVSGHYVDNVRDGRWVQWYPNGQRKQETTYVKGKPEGRFREWDERGEPLADAVYQHGKVVQ